MLHAGPLSGGNDRAGLGYAQGRSVVSVARLFQRLPQVPVPMTVRILHTTFSAASLSTTDIIANRSSLFAEAGRSRKVSVRMHGVGHLVCSPCTSTHSSHSTVATLDLGWSQPAACRTVTVSNLGHLALGASSLRKPNWCDFGKTHARHCSPPFRLPLERDGNDYYRDGH
jgi:hypothetical protein